MNKTLIFSLILLTVIATACGVQAAQPSPLPATATEAVIVPAATNTSVPVPTEAQVSQTESPTQPAAPTVSFANDILPIFNNSCNKCHGVEQVKEGLDMRTYETLMAGSFNGSVITPGSANDSFLVEQIINGEMPKRGQKLLPAQIQLIIDWINAGALNN